MERRKDFAGAGSVLYDYRFAKDNGWHCGCWHESPEAAARCLLERTSRKVEEYIAS